MGKNTLKRSLIVGIIFLFLSTTCNSVLASELFNVKKYINEKATSEAKTVDSYREIITSVDGNCTEITIKGLGFVRRAEIWAGGMKTITVLDGYKFPILNNSGSHFTIYDATHIKIPHFIGFRWKGSTYPGTYWVHGIALGNIEWG